MKEKELYKNDDGGEITTLTINDLDLYYVKLVSSYFSNRNVVCLTKSEALNIAIKIFENEGVPIATMIINSLLEQGRI